MVKEGYKEVRVGPKTKLIPEEWKVKKLKKVIKKRKGKRPNKLFDSKNGENSIPYLSVNYLRGNDFPEWCSKNDDNKVEVKENEILMIWDGSYSGNVFMGFNGALSSTMARLKCEDDINNQYLFYQLRNNFKIFQSTTIGTSVPHVAGKIFENLNIPTPPKREQKKIASILSSVDKSIEKTDKVIEETKELKKGLMQELLTKGIGHSEFKEVLIAVRKFDIPSSWELKNIESFTKEFTSGGTPSTDEEDFWDGDIYFITGAYIKNREIEEGKDLISKKGLENSSSNLIPKNNVIICTRTAVGNIGKNLIDIAISQDVTGIILDKDIIDVDYFIWSIIRFKYLLKVYQQGSTIKGITRNVLKNFKIPLPPLEEQKKIASILSSVDAKIKKEEEYKAKLERLKKGLMQKLLTGEIRVNTEMEV